MIFRKLAINSVNRATTTLDGFAGKSINVAKVLKALGERPFATGFLGGDRGARLQAFLETRRIQHRFLTVPVPTRECVTVINEFSKEQTELVEESLRTSGGWYKKLLQLIKGRVQGCKAVVMSGTITPGGPVDFYKRCTQMGNQAGSLTVVDAKGFLLIESLNARPGLVKPNCAELSVSLGRKVATQAAVIRAMHELHDRGAERVVVTAGRGPALAFDGRSLWRVFPPAVRALNPIGSGDSFTAAMVYRLVRGDQLSEACRWGSAAGAANALSAMPGDLNRNDVQRLRRNVRVERL
jgi:tagatose 6-phosphate kinase